MVSRKEIEEYRKRNGYISYSIQELLLALNLKFDKQAEKINNHEKEAVKQFTKLKTTQKFHWIALGSLTTAVSFIITFLIRKGMP